MPVKIKEKALKASKENAGVKPKHKIKTVDNVGPQRKVLGDKTNSASDDNASMLSCEKLPKKTVSAKKTGKEHINEESNIKATERPRRARRVPTRFIENNVEVNDKVSFRKSSSHSIIRNLNNKEPVVVLTPLKIPNKAHDCSLIINRPRRICRLPSKFDENFTSPNKILCVQPINASTPLAIKTKTVKKGKKDLSSSIISGKKLTPKKITKKVSIKKLKEFQTTLSQKSPKQSRITSFLKKKTADTNNNAKNNKNKSSEAVQKSPDKKGQLNNSKTEKNKIREQNLSIRILDDKKSLKRNSNKLDVYEFTFDPSEEPPPAKKKKKKNATKKPSKPRKVTYKSSYEKNLAKALATLKNTVAPAVTHKDDKQIIDPLPSGKSTLNQPVASEHKVDQNQTSKKGHAINPSCDQDNVITECETVNKNYNSVRLEDIALDIQPDDDNLNYSPVNTPSRLKTPVGCNGTNRSIVNDPLHLQGELSFFDEQPAASSSMNQSMRHPAASPWRVEFGCLPIKWQVNTYVKPNMTPALESSFINFNDIKKKHVYTNIVPTNVTLSEVAENLKQTSIISFIKEAVEKSAKKKKKSSPVKNNSLFEDVTNSFMNVDLTPTKETSISKSKAMRNKSGPFENITSDTNTTNESSIEDGENDTGTAAKIMENDKNMTFFGFDESENQENASPTKKKNKSTKSKNRRVLRELNTLKGPTRPAFPVAAKTKTLQNVDKANEHYENMKSATEPPVFPDMSIAGNTEVTNVDPQDDNEDSQSVHLFEDIEVVHHHKAIRKSYSKPKRVMFKPKAVVNRDDSSNSDEDNQVSSEDELHQSFTLPTIQLKKPTKKRVTKKQKFSKKEEKEVEAWAAGFNSMCEDIEEFDLVVE